MARGRRDPNRAAQEGILVGKAHRSESKLLSGSRRRRVSAPVEIVAHYRAASRQQVQADLVSAAGIRTGFDQCPTALT